MDDLASHQARGAVGPTTQATNINAGANHVPQRTAHGGATAGTFANRSRTGNPSPKGVGNQSLVPNGAPTVHTARKAAQLMGRVQNAVRQGLMHPAEGKRHMTQLQGHLDSYAQAKRSAAVRASKPRFGSLGSGSVDDSVARGQVQSDVPGGSAMDTGRSPLQQRSSGGRSQVPNANFGGGPRGPGYDYDD